MWVCIFWSVVLKIWFKMKYTRGSGIWFSQPSLSSWNPLKQIYTGIWFSHKVTLLCQNQILCLACWGKIDFQGRSQIEAKISCFTFYYFCVFSVKVAICKGRCVSLTFTREKTFCFHSVFFLNSVFIVQFNGKGIFRGKSYISYDFLR